jgi:ABC-type thiamin/hydroxymethylpyrimidine transport system permease subunit
MTRMQLREESKKRNPAKDLSLLVVISAVGGSTSVLVGYAGQAISSLAILPFATPQLLSGLHVFWLILAAVLIRRRGSATFVGCVKGLVEIMLSSHLGPFALAVSLIEGFAADLAFTVFGKKPALAIYLASGFSAASNLLVVQLFFWPTVPLAIFVLAYSVAFISGLVLSGFLSRRVLGVLQKTLDLPT